MTDNGKPKYFSLMEQLRSDIMSGAIRPGEKLPSENELSQKYSLSRHTVRKALGILEQDGYVEAFHGRGTYCSENMRHIKNSKNIAVVTTYISDYIFPRLIQGMDNVLSESGYSIILKNTANSRQKEARCLEELLKKDIDGLIIEPSKSEMICKHRNLYQNLDKFEIPYVFIQGIYSEMRDKPHILMDDAQGGYLVTKYLLELGHKKIKGFFCNFRAYAEMFQHLAQHCMPLINMNRNIISFLKKCHRTITVHRNITILTKQLHSMTYTRFRYPKHRCNIYRTNSATLF